jgi:hypothetical protein
MSVLPLKERAMVYSVRNDVHHDTTGTGYPNCLMVVVNRVDDTFSNAPHTLRKRAVMVRYLLQPISMSCMSAIVALMVDHWGWPPIWSRCRRSWVSAIPLSLKAISFSRTFPSQFNKAIVRYALGLLYSGLLGFGMTTMVDCHQGHRWYPIAPKVLYSLLK